MDVQVTARNCEVSDELHEAAAVAMRELVEQEPRISFCKVVFAEVKEERAVAAVCAIRGVGSAVAHTEGKDWEVNVRLLKDRLGERIRVVCEEAEED